MRNPRVNENPIFSYLAVEVEHIQPSTLPVARAFNPKTMEEAYGVLRHAYPEESGSAAHYFEWIELLHCIVEDEHGVAHPSYYYFPHHGGVIFSKTKQGIFKSNRMSSKVTEWWEVEIVESAPHPVYFSNEHQPTKKLKEHYVKRMAELEIEELESKKTKLESMREKRTSKSGI